jgi:hypothetical protein
MKRHRCLTVCLPGDGRSYHQRERITARLRRDHHPEPYRLDGEGRSFFEQTLPVSSTCPKVSFMDSTGHRHQRAYHQGIARPAGGDFTVNPPDPVYDVFSYCLEEYVNFRPSWEEVVLTRNCIRWITLQSLGLAQKDRSRR